MKKTLVAVMLVVLGLGAFTGVAAAQTTPPATGTLHEYMENALAEKLGLPLATVEAQIEAGTKAYQIALDNGIAQEDLRAFMLEVRTNAINAALADGVITQAQADRMLKASARGMRSGRGSGMMRAGTGLGLCEGTGTQRGGRWQQTNP